MAQVAESVENAFLISPIDREALRTYTGKMDAAVRGWNFEHVEKSYLEGFGFTAAQDYEESVTEGRTLLRLLETAYTGVVRILELVPPEVFPKATGSLSAPSYRRNTAFIMMQIAKEMDDTLDAVVQTFKEYGVTATRADQIEHDGVITQKILEELTTSEFLFADLTGERPSVYYEIGYAHALGKRVILFRKQGTYMHFDLIVHNCPEYSSLRDLKEKLTNRLKAMTGRESTNESLEN